MPAAVMDLQVPEYMYVDGEYQAAVVLASVLGPLMVLSLKVHEPKYLGF